MLWPVVITLVALNIGAIILLKVNRKRRLTAAHLSALPIWSEAAKALGLELMPRVQHSDVIGLTGQLDGLSIAVWGLHVDTRGLLDRDRGYWTQIQISAPALTFGLRPTEPRTPWLERDSSLLTIATPGFAAHAGYIPPQSDAVAVEGAPASLLVFGDGERASARLEEDPEQITRWVVGRSLYVHDGALQLNQRNLPDDAERLARDIRELVEFVNWLCK